MWFKNLTLYRFNKPFSIETEALETALADFTFSPCGSQDVSKFGFSNMKSSLAYCHALFRAAAKHAH